MLNIDSLSKEFIMHKSSVGPRNPSIPVARIRRRE